MSSSANSLAQLRALLDLAAHRTVCRRARLPSSLWDNARAALGSGAIPSQSLSVVEIRVGNQRFLVGLRSDFPLKPNSVSPRSALALVSRQTAELARLQARLDPHAKVRDHAAWLEAEVARGRLAVVPVVDPTVADAPLANPTSAIRPQLTLSATAHPARAPGVGSWSTVSKVTEMVMRSPSYMPEEVRNAFLAFLSPEALKMLAATLVVWGSGHLVGIGEAIDVLLLGVGYAMIGWQVFDAVGSLAKGVGMAIAAEHGPELDVAAQEFAKGVTTLGINAILVLLTRGAKGKAPAAAEQAAAAEARMAFFIEQLELRFDTSRGALWSRLGDAGDIAAARLARTEGRVTLEMALSDTKFAERYAAEFGKDFNLNVWTRMSEKFASKLTGQVVVYVDRVALQSGSPLVGAELMTFLDRPGVTSVIIKDVSGKFSPVVWDHAAIAKARLAAPISGRWN